MGRRHRCGKHGRIDSRIGDFYLSPYRILAPRRINSRNAEARFGIRGVPRDDVSFIEGIPVTGAERTS